MPTNHKPGLKLTGERNECPRCGELFNSNFAFDKHRTGDFGVHEGPRRRRCLTPEEMVAKGMAKNKQGFWVGNQRPDNLVNTLQG